MKGRPRSTDPEICDGERFRRKYREEHRAEYNEYQRNLFIGDTERSRRRKEYMREYCRNWWRKHHLKMSNPE
jgi:hypothetical protein